MSGYFRISLARRAHFGHNLGEGQEMISLLPSLLHLGDLSHTPITGTVWAHQEDQGILDPLADSQDQGLQESPLPDYGRTVRQ